MIVIVRRQWLRISVFKQVSWLAGDIRLRQTLTLRIHLVQRQCLWLPVPLDLVLFTRAPTEASLSTSDSRPTAGPIVLSLYRNKPVTDCSAEKNTSLREKDKVRIVSPSFYGRIILMFLLFPDPKPSSARVLTLLVQNAENANSGWLLCRWGVKDGRNLPWRLWSHISEHRDNIWPFDFTRP